MLWDNVQFQTPSPPKKKTHIIYKKLLNYKHNIIGLLHEYCPEQWYTARDNIHAITLLLYYSNKYFFFRSVINTVKIWFFHISLLHFVYCTRKNILIFALVQYEFCFISGKQRKHFQEHWPQLVHFCGVQQAPLYLKERWCHPPPS